LGWEEGSYVRIGDGGSSLLVNLYYCCQDVMALDQYFMRLSGSESAAANGAMWSLCEDVRVVDKSDMFTGSIVRNGPRNEMSPWVQPGDTLPFIAGEDMVLAIEQALASCHVQATLLQEIVKRCQRL
jgi:hypothetical protein